MITLSNVKDVKQILAQSQAIEEHLEKEIKNLKLIVKKLAKSTTVAFTQC